MSRLYPFTEEKRRSALAALILTNRALGRALDVMPRGPVRAALARRHDETLDFIETERRSLLSDLWRIRARARRAQEVRAC